jgi:phage N-6-adenine-methyltransferase
VSSNWDTLWASDRQDWETPAYLFRALDAEFHFTLDVCALPHNAKCARYFTPEQNGLAQDWGHEVCWCNPPYDDVTEWARKCWLASLGGATVVLLAFSRTDTKWFHNFVYGKAELRFIKGRVKFVGAKSGAPAPSMLAIFRPTKG